MFLGVNCPGWWSPVGVDDIPTNHYHQSRLHVLSVESINFVDEVYYFKITSQPAFE